jgi:hypothetical protein
VAILRPATEARSLDLDRHRRLARAYRIDSLEAIRDQAKADAERAHAMLENSGKNAVTTQMVRTFAETARQTIRREGGGYRRDHLRALAQRVEVAEREVRIMGLKSRLLQTLVANSGANAVPTQGLNWRREWDSNPRYAFTHTRFPSVRLKPLGHLSRGPEPRSSGAAEQPRRRQASIFSAARNADWGISTLPNWRMRFLPSFCFSSSLRLRLMSPP